MFCYLDRTFCTKSRNGCANVECHRYFTKELSEQADKWAFDSGLTYAPVAYADFSQTCGKLQKPINPIIGGVRRSAQISQDSGILTIEPII